MSGPALLIESLTAGYGDIQVLWGVDLAVQSHEIVCMIGYNGVGKSTLLRTVSGLVPVTGGSIRYGNIDLSSATPADVLKAGIAHVPEGRRLFSAMSVQDNLIMGAFLRRDTAQIKRDLEQVFEHFPILFDRRNQDAGTLSGGEQQMCAVGRGLMSAPKLLMIDELSLGLAPQIVEQLSDILLRVRDTGIAIFVVEQDVHSALELADRGFVVDRGRVTLSGEASDLLVNPKVREAYMGIA